MVRPPEIDHAYTANLRMIIPRARQVKSLQQQLLALDDADTTATRRAIEAEARMREAEKAKVGDSATCN